MFAADQTRQVEGLNFTGHSETGETRRRSETGENQQMINGSQTLSGLSTPPSPHTHIQHFSLFLSPSHCSVTVGLIINFFSHKTATVRCSAASEYSNGNPEVPQNTLFHLTADHA